MKTITIKAPRDINCNMKEWEAKYAVEVYENVRLITVQSRSAIDIVVAKIIQHNSILGDLESFYISSPNFGVAIPGISSLHETFWITEQLLHHKLSAPDAVTIAQVLNDLGDF